MSAVKRELTGQVRTSVEKRETSLAGSRQLSRTFAKKASTPSVGKETKHPGNVNRKISPNYQKNSPILVNSAKVAKESLSVYKLYTSESKELLSESNKSEKEIAPLQLMMSFKNLTSSELNSLDSSCHKFQDSFADLKTSKFSLQNQSSDRKPILAKKGPSESLKELAKNGDGTNTESSNTKQIYSRMFEQAVINQSTRKSYKNPKSIGKKIAQSQIMNFNTGHPKDFLKPLGLSKLTAKSLKRDESKTTLKKKESDSDKRGFSELDPKALIREDSPHVNTVAFESPIKPLCDIKQQKKQNSSKGTNSTISQGTSLGKVIKNRSKSIIQWQESQDPHLDSTPVINKKLRRGETLELGRIRQEEDKESKTDEKTEVKTRPKLRKTQSSYDVVARSKHAIILGKYGKFQSR